MNYPYERRVEISNQQKGRKMAKFIMVHALNKIEMVLGTAILNSESFDSIVPASQYAEKYPKELGIGAVIFQREPIGLLREGKASSFAVKETVAELWEMLK